MAVPRPPQRKKKKIDLAQVPMLQGRVCEACGSPIDARDHFCTACGMPQHEMTAPPTPVGQGKPVAPTTVPPPTEMKAGPDLHSFQCQNCSSTITLDPGTRSYVCPFCESTYVVELPVDPLRQRPEFIVGFALTPEQAWEKFQAWLRRGSWVRPLNLREVQAPDRLRGVYLPFWSFSMLARCRWSATIGEYWYRTETYTVRVNGKTETRTRTVTETEWWPLDGRFQRYYFGYLISASKGLSQDLALRMMPYHLSAAKRYEPYFLAGWTSEEYSIGRQMALSHCQEEFHARAGRDIAAFLPGDVQRDLQYQVNYEDTSSDLFLLPVYLLTYMYQGHQYHFIMNGQTGELYGERPLSWLRIGLYALAVVLIGLAIGIALQR